MCDIDTDGNRWSAERRRSRKRRWCHACTEPIARGQFYVRVVGYSDGRALVTPQCDRCHAIWNGLASMMLGEAIRFDLNCGEYIDDPDHPLQWLAFALPTDAAVQP